MKPSLTESAKLAYRRSLWLSRSTNNAAKTRSTARNTIRFTSSPPATLARQEACRGWLAILAIGLALNVAWPVDSFVSAQQPPVQTTPQKKAEPEKKPKDIPPARVVQLQTKPQGNIPPINLSCTWFAGVNDKNTVPVMLLHDWGSSNKSLMPLAQHLQKELGCAVLVPDLRGHGASTSLVGGGKKLDAGNMNKQEIPFATEDIEACKRFLKERHNAGELNIEMLTLIACGDTTALAAAWAASDWQWPPYNGVKQGQDSKLLILLSPVRKFEALNLAALLKTPLFSDPSVAGLTTVLFWDPDHAASEREAAALESTLTKGLGPMPGGKDEERWSKIRYALKVVNGGGYGQRLLSGEKGDVVKKEITSFIEQKLATRAEKYPWTNRTEK